MNPINFQMMPLPPQIFCTCMNNNYENTPQAYQLIPAMLMPATMANNNTFNCFCLNPLQQIPNEYNKINEAIDVLGQAISDLMPAVSIDNPIIKLQAINYVVNRLNSTLGYFDRDSEMGKAILTVFKNIEKKLQEDPLAIDYVLTKLENKQNKLIKKAQAETRIC